MSNTMMSSTLVSSSTEVSQELVSLGPSGMGLTPAYPTNQFQTVFTWIFDSSNKKESVNFRNSKEFSLLTGLFESVKLISCDFRFELPPDTGVNVQFCITHEANPPANLAVGIGYRRFGGNQLGYTTHNLVYRSTDFAYGTELKTPNLGTPTPIFHFVATTTSQVEVIGHLSFSVHGRAPPVNLSEARIYSYQFPVAKLVEMKPQYAPNQETVEEENEE